jgi:acetylornithine deacetylase/succinyl-diaminopimelate desuccinylase-like protein
VTFSLPIIHSNKVQNPMWQIDTELTIRYLQEMVRIDSVNPGLVAGGKGEGAVAEWLGDVCRELGLTVEFQETAPSRPNVIARWQGTGSYRCRECGEHGGRSF